MNLHGISTINPMSHMFLPNTTAPTATTGANGSSGTSGTSGTTGGSGNSATDAADQAQSTFISLLVTELQAQDPTQPMDPTQMVSQMFSMNQLEQLISINQTLTNAFGPLEGANASGANNSSNPAPNQPLTGGN